MVALCLSGEVKAQAVSPTTEETSPASVHGEPLKWDSNWQTVSSFDYGLSLGTGAIGLAALIFGPGREGAYRGRPGFDVRTRRALRAPTARGRLWARDVSDVLVTLLASYPIAIDGLLNASWYRQSPEVAEQMILMDLEANALSAGITSVFKAMVRRERPYGEDCGGAIDPDTSDCLGVDRFYSHFSGHASVSFVAASLTCVHHANLPLWGATSWWIPCAGSYALAATTATLRVVADRHYLSDVAVGAVSGALAGFLVPWLHYNNVPDSPQEQSWLNRHRVGLIPTPRSVALTGTF